jgi:hypothetical protein
MIENLGFMILTSHLMADIKNSDHGSINNVPLCSTLILFYNSCERIVNFDHIEDRKAENTWQHRS